MYETEDLNARKAKLKKVRTCAKCGEIFVARTNAKYCFGCRDEVIMKQK